MKHPKPWKVTNGELSENDSLSAVGLNWDIWDADEQWVTATKDEQTALEIVRAVNAHEALVGALEKVKKQSDGVKNLLFTSKGAIKRIATLVQEALTIAKETTT